MGRELICPAAVHGVIGGCRFCQLEKGSGVCGDVVDAHHRGEQGKNSRSDNGLRPDEQVQAPKALPDIAINTPSEGADKVRKQVMLSMGVQYTVGD